MRRIKLFITAALFFLVACAYGQQQRALTANLTNSLPLQQQSILGTSSEVDTSQSKLITFSSPLPDSINMHIVQAPDGLVLFDTLRRADQVDEAMKLIKRLNQPVKAIFITHAHTDHYGGVVFFRSYFPNVPIYSSEDVLIEMRDDVIPDNANRRAMFGSRFPTQQQINEHLPNRLVEDRKPLFIAGLQVVPYLMGPSESAAAVVYALPELNQIIVGDLVNVLTISAPTLSLQNWLSQLQTIKSVSQPEMLMHVGHGPSGPAHSLIDDQITYLTRLDQYVDSALADGQGVSREETAQIVYDMRLAYPHHKGAAFMPPEQLIGLSVGWVTQQKMAEQR